MKSEKIIISIIIPVFNGDKVIERCLKSIYECSVNLPFEVIVVDDGSTDNTAQIVKKYPCRYLYIEKSGAAAARNRGIRAARGEYLFFFDADVILMKDTVEKIMFHFRNDDDAFIIQGRWHEKSPLDTFSSRFLLIKYTYYFRNCFKSGIREETANLETGCLGIRKEVFNQVSGFNEDYKSAGGEEHELRFRLPEKYRIFYYSDIFVFHAFGPISATVIKIFRRAINFSMLCFGSASQKKFLKMHSISASRNDIRSVILIFLMIVSVGVFLFRPYAALSAVGGLLVLYFMNIYDFFRYMAKTESAVFALKGVAANAMIMLPRLAGVICAFFLFYVLGWKHKKI